MPTVYDHRAILGYLERDAYRWNAMQDLGFPVFVSYTFLDHHELPTASSMPYYASTVQSMSYAQRGAMRNAFLEFENTAGMVFVETTGDAMIESIAVTGSSYGGWAEYPYVDDTSGSTSQLVIDVSDGDQTIGFGFEILLHEIGHAVGLSHPHDGTYTLGAHLDTTTQTIMSYNWASYPVTNLAPLDVTALREIYGGPVNLTGWTYGFNGSVFEVRATSGDDRIAGVITDNKLLGGAGNDIIIGREGDDIINGGNGRDILIGGEGADIIRGGNGNDKIYSGGEGTGYFYDPFDHKIAGGRGNDLIYAQSGDDFIKGELGNDRIFSGSGSDMIVGGKGADRITTGYGRDTIVFFPKTDGDRDVVTDFTYYSDSLDFRVYDVTRDDINLRETDDGRDTMLKIDIGEDLPFRVLFLNVTEANLERYFDSYHDFG